MMLELDGLEVLKQVRAFATVPIIILTAKASDRDLIACLEAGADDYLAKPFNVNELAARMRAVLRRSTADGDAIDDRLVFDTLMVDFGRRRVDVNGQSVALTRNEWRLLVPLVRHAGHLFTHEELLNQAWGPTAARDFEYLRVWMSRLRKKLTSAGMDPGLIATLSGIGYAFARRQQ
jgi:two-component system KDP operon response regulator KdpE